jgi:hypothetical protein
MDIAITAMRRVGHLRLGACAIHLLATLAIHPHFLHAQTTLILSVINARIQNPTKLRARIELSSWD